MSEGGLAGLVYLSLFDPGELGRFFKCTPPTYADKSTLRIRLKLSTKLLAIQVSNFKYHLGTLVVSTLISRLVRLE